MRVVVLLSAAGGGDRQPVIAAAVALNAAGHDVLVVTDTATAKLIAPTGLPAYVHQVDQVGFISEWIEALSEDASPENPLEKWGRLTLPAVIDRIREFAPDALVSSLFCMGLTSLAAQQLDLSWCFVNPSFYFGEASTTTWENDWHGQFVPRLARDCFSPLVDQADLVLHGTDPIFDFVPPDLPANHRYTGFLIWESSSETPNFLLAPGDPWALVTASTSRPADEQRMIDASVSALSGRPVRAVLTLPKHDPSQQIGDAHIVGYSPHTPILQRSAISINQAGHGIVSKCLVSGVPMVLLPWDADQPGVATRAKALGVAAVVSREEVSEETVRDAVSDVLGDPTYQDHSRAVALELQNRTPAHTAVSLIEQI